MKPSIHQLLILLIFFAFTGQVVAACNPAQVVRNDVLVVVNDNSKSSPEVGDYYCEQRSIDPNNVAHVRVPVTNDVELDQFVSLRDQIIKHMQENTLPSGTTAIACDTAQGYTRFYCPESIDQLRENSSIRYVVMTKGLPIRFRFTGSTLLHNPEASVDNYLRFWLTNYFSEDVNFRNNTRAIAFADGRGMREINPITDYELIIGRIDGVDAESAKQLVDRAISAEKDGIFGKLYGSKFGGSAESSLFGGGAYWKRWLPNGGTETIYPSSDYLHGLFGELQGLTDPATNPAVRHTINPECISLDADGKIPKECVTAINPGATGGKNLPAGTSGGRIPLPDNALFHQNYLGTFSILEQFDDLLNWRDTASCNTLCGNDAICKAASTDAYKEIDTRCVRVADGYIGYSHKSYPIGLMASWPTGWFQSVNSHPNKFDLTGSEHYYFWQPEVRNDTGFNDSFSLWYRGSDEEPSSQCYAGTESYNTVATNHCVQEKRISLNQIIEIPERSINPTPQEITIRFKYRAIGINKGVSLIARLLVREAEYDDGTITLSPTNQAAYDPREVTLLKTPNDPVDGSSWGDAEVSLTLDPNLHQHPQKLYNGIKIRIQTTTDFEGELAFDDFSVVEDGVTIPLVNPSFDNGHQQLSGGDTAATFLSRLNGAAFWGNVTHHESNGHSFDAHPFETLIYFLRGLPLGDAVWLAETHNAGMFYGDPLYSPAAIHLHYLTAVDDWAPQDQFSTIHDSPLTLIGDTLNGSGESVTTTYSIDYCFDEDDFLICDQNSKWTPVTNIQNLLGGQRNLSLGGWDLSSLSDGDGDYILRLAVTSSNASKGLAGLTQTFYDYYPINLYTPLPDEDEDGLSYEEEIAAGTNPRNGDTDNDGLSDKFEIDNGLDPLTDNTNLDSDGDGVEDFIETLRGTDVSDDQDFPIISELTVDPTNGIDDGSSPFKTFEAALNTALAGDKILLLSGTYDAISIDFTVPVNLQGPSDKSAIFQSVRSLRNREAGTIAISGLTFSSSALTILGDKAGSINRWRFSNNNFNTNLEIKSGVLTEFVNSLFTGASLDAINLLDGSSVELRNSTLTNNTTGISANTGSNVKIINSIISGNTNADLVGISPNDVFYSLAINILSTSSDIFAETNGNISNNPLFVDAPNGDYHLKPESPAIDAGDPQSDFSSEPTSTVGRINLGVYGNTGEATIAGPKDPGGGQQPEQSSSSGQVSWTLILWLSLYGVWRTGRKY